MKRILVVLIAMALPSFGAASWAAADDVAVIVNKSNPVKDLTMVQLRKIVLGEETAWLDGNRIAVLMTTPGQAERDTTLRIVCRMSETSFTLHFTHASFKRTMARHGGLADRGTADPPQAFGSGVQVRQAVARATNAVGFIKASQLDDSVKVITIDGSGPGQPAYKLNLK